jgi:hypothetical protein
MKFDLSTLQYLKKILVKFTHIGALALTAFAFLSYR